MRFSIICCQQSWIDCRELVCRWLFDNHTKYLLCIRLRCHLVANWCATMCAVSVCGRGFLNIGCQSIRRHLLILHRRSWQHLRSCVKLDFTRSSMESVKWLDKCWS